MRYVKGVGLTLVVLLNTRVPNTDILSIYLCISTGVYMGTVGKKNPVVDPFKIFILLQSWK